MLCRIHRSRARCALEAAALLFAMALPHVGNSQNYAATRRPGAQRQVQGHTIVSAERPHAQFVVNPHLRYLGSQTVDLHGNAEAEQFLFVDATTDRHVRRFCWIQFEHFLPTNAMHYDSDTTRVTSLGDLTFFYDVWAYTDYSVAAADPRSDGAAAAALLADHGLSFPVRMARVRLFHYPTADRRSEVMVIYGEAVPDSSSIPVAGNRTSLDRSAPNAAALLVAHARDALTVRRRDPWSVSP